MTPGLLEQGKRKDLDVLALDDAMKALARIDVRKAQVVELRFFGGLNFDETADVLKYRRSPGRATGARREPGCTAK
jgi:hypothetical protein